MDRRDHLNYAGVLLFLAGTVALMGIITAETQYPGYSTAENAISDLGATPPPNSVVVEPSATIFNATTLVTGLLSVAAAYLVSRGLRGRLVPALLGLFGVGVFGVGVFPGNYGDLHAIFALLAFTAGGLSALSGYTAVRSPFRYVAALLGAVVLVDLVLYFALGEASPFWVLGFGGLERWLAYPVLLWITGFGGYLMSWSTSAARGEPT